MPGTGDRWQAGDTYEAFMGRWSRQLAPRFVAWLAPGAGLHWLDVGCGTGAFTQAIAAHAAPASVTGCDPSESFIEHARAHAANPDIRFVVAGAGSLPPRPGGYDHIGSSLALNFFPAPDDAIHEMRTLAASGGVISACVWDYAGRMGFLRHFWDAAIANDPAARGLDEGARFPICRPDALTSLFTRAGLGGVRAEAIEIATRFASFDDLWRPLLGGTGPAPAYVAALDPARRDALRETLRGRLPIEADGGIPLIAGAIAVRGRVD